MKQNAFNTITTINETTIVHPIKLFDLAIDPSKLATLPDESAADIKNSLYEVIAACDSFRDTAITKIGLDESGRTVLGNRVVYERVTNEEGTLRHEVFYVPTSQYNAVYVITDSELYTSAIHDNSMVLGAKMNLNTEDVEYRIYNMNDSEFELSAIYHS